MAEVENSTYEIEHLHTRSMQEWKVPYTLITFDQEHVCDRYETAQHEYKEREHTIDGVSAWNNNYIPPRQWQCNGV